MDGGLKVSEQVLLDKIYLINGVKVMLDSDLSELYHTDTKRLNEQVKRNLDRFPKDFMFQLTEKQWNHLKSQIATSSWGGRRTLPYAFTEQGIAMLSGVLKSKVAIRVHIQIIRVFIKMRQHMSVHKDIYKEIEDIRKQAKSQDEKISLIFNYLKQFVKEKDEPKGRIGYVR